MSKKDNKEKKEQVESAEAEKRNNANQSGQKEEQKCAQSDGKADDSEKQESEADKMKRELEEQKDRYLRLSAEFDNYRRRVSKEKLDLIETASESVIKSLLPIIDDFERAVKALEESTDSDAAKEGTNLIYKKLVDLLKSRGVSEIEAVGKELDTDIHEAVAQIPAPEEGLKGKIVDCVQKGYKLGEKVIRFAKVVVGI